MITQHLLKMLPIIQSYSEDQAKVFRAGVNNLPPVKTITNNNEFFSIKALSPLIIACSGLSTSYFLNESGWPILSMVIMVLLVFPVYYKTLCSMITVQTFTSFIKHVNRSYIDWHRILNESRVTGVKHSLIIVIVVVLVIFVHSALVNLDNGLWICSACTILFVLPNTIRAIRTYVLSMYIVTFASVVAKKGGN